MTQSPRRIQFIGTTEDEGARIQIEAWRSYFSELLDYWMEHKALPKSGLEYWAILS